MISLTLALLSAPGPLVDDYEAELGHTYAGSLSTSDGSYDDGSFVDYYWLPVRAGERVAVTLRSTSFDAWLQLHLPEEQGGTLFNDDMAEGTLDAQLVYVFEESGEFQFGITSANPGETGAYEVSFERLGGGGGGEDRVLRGALGEGDQERYAGGPWADHYLFPCRAGDTVRVRMESNQLDAYLEVQGGGLSSALTNDDSGGTLDSLVEFTATQTGHVEVVASTPIHRSAGFYMLTVAGARAGGSDLEFDGVLADGDETFTSGEYYDEFTFAAAAGETLVVTMQSTQLDAYVVLRPPTGDAVANDDGFAHPLARQARVEHVCEESGEYTIQATSHQPGEAGAYTVAVHRPDASEQSAAGAVAAALGSSYTGRLESDDAQFADGSFVDYYDLRVEAGDTVTVTLSSADFDSWLYLPLPSSPQGYLVNDDLSPLTLDAQLVHTFQEAGVHRFNATSRASGSIGAYTISFEAGARSAPTAGAADRVTLHGVLEAGDRQLGGEGEYYDHYVLHCADGDRVRVSTASPVDTYLIVQGPGIDGQLDDDDSGDQLNALVEFTAVGSGDLEISVTTASPGVTGAYDLIVEGATPYQGGRTWTGALAEGDAELSSGEYYDEYTFFAERGEVVELTMQSSELDSYLILVPPVADNVENDDAEHVGTWLHARIVYTCPDEGEYRVIVTSAMPGESGEYELWVRGTGADDAPPVGGVQTVSGRLTAANATRALGQYVAPYSFEGVAGERVAIEMRSSEIDSYLILTPPSGEPIERDDIDEFDRDARIELTLPVTGTYRIGATSYEPQVGAFTLHAEGLGSRLVADSSAAVTTERQYWAILCGITNYSPDDVLENCKRDAERLAGGLMLDGVLSATNMVILVDEEATAEGVREAFAQLAPKVRPGDVFLFFYSGHGGRGGLDEAAIDEPDRRDEYLALYEGQIFDDELKQLFGTIRAKLSILCLDSCFSGGFARDVISEPGRLGIFSSEEDVLSVVADEFNAGGYLSHFFRRGLRGEADRDDDKVVTVGELDRFLREEFKKLDILTETDEGAIGYQHLVIERGGVQVTEPLVRITDN